MTASKQVERDFLTDEEELAIVALRPWANRATKRKLGDRDIGWEEGIAALNRVIIRMIAGGDVNPDLRRLFVRLLQDVGRVRLVPQQTTGRGRPANRGREYVVEKFLEKALEKQSRKSAYGAAATMFGVTPRQVERIMQRRRHKISI